MDVSGRVTTNIIAGVPMNIIVFDLNDGSKFNTSGEKIGFESYNVYKACLFSNEIHLYLKVLQSNTSIF